MHFLGEVKSVSFGFVPRGWAKCNGHLVLVADHPSLFGLIGYAYGGVGELFALPNLQDRSIRGGTPGQVGGNDAAVLGVSNLPLHSHGVKPSVNSYNVNDGDETSAVGTYPGSAATDRFYETANATGGEYTTESTGGGEPISVANPHLKMMYIIAMEGEAPTR